MPMQGRTTCAVRGCTMPIQGPNNLCDEHCLPGGIVQAGHSTMIITVWVAEHGDESGIILLNDWALGAYFGGRKGFEAKLAEQGFVNIRNLKTEEELLALRSLLGGFGDWGGPWRTEYPWESSDGFQFAIPVGEAGEA